MVLLTTLKVTAISVIKKGKKNVNSYLSPDVNENNKSKVKETRTIRNYITDYLEIVLAESTINNSINCKQL